MSLTQPQGKSEQQNSWRLFFAEPQVSYHKSFRKILPLQEMVRTSPYSWKLEGTRFSLHTCQDLKTEIYFLFPTGTQRKNTSTHPWPWKLPSPQPDNPEALNLVCRAPVCTMCRVQSCFFPHPHNALPVSVWTTDHIQARQGPVHENRQTRRRPFLKLWPGPSILAVVGHSQNTDSQLTWVSPKRSRHLLLHFGS